MKQQLMVRTKTRRCYVLYKFKKDKKLLFEDELENSKKFIKKLAFCNNTLKQGILLRENEIWFLNSEQKLH